MQRRATGVLEMPRQQALQTFRSGGVALMSDEIRASLAGFGVHFDVFFNEKDLHDRGELDAALATLRQAGHVYGTNGATWVRTTEFGDDKDRVYVRSNGEFTYFAADCAYYLDKRGRGFGKIVIILGADHHGYVGRLRAIAACFGDDPDQTLEILIGQPGPASRRPRARRDRPGAAVAGRGRADSPGQRPRPARCHRTRPLVALAVSPAARRRIGISGQRAPVADNIWALMST